MLEHSCRFTFSRFIF